jgi:hypothetical protein
MSNGLSNYEPMDSIIQEAPLGHGVAQDFGTEHEQGYDDRLDESLGMSNRESGMSQSRKSRRDESKGMERALGNRPYSRVGTMDEPESFGADRSRYGNRYVTRNKKGQIKTNVSVGRSLTADRRVKAKNVPSKPRRGHQGDYHSEEFEAKYRIREKHGEYWYKDSKTGANIKKLNKNRVLGNDRVRKAKRIPMNKANRRMYGHVGDFGLKGNMAETHAAEGDFKTGFQYGAGATVGVVSAVVVTGFLIQGIQSLFNRD